jgi:predicted nucleotide-binding protein (sugar kinase/HSP70/actin superfamily)
VLEQALHDARPVETRDGAAVEIHRRWSERLWRLLEERAAGDLSAARVLAEVTGGSVYGVAELLAGAARELAAVRSQREVPTVLVVGEIYVRSDPFANGFVAEGLERRGIRARLEPVHEFLQYADHIAHVRSGGSGTADRVERVLRERILGLCHTAAARVLGWSDHVPVAHHVASAAPYLREELEVESVLTIGGSTHAWRRGEVDAVVSVGPLECMPNKVAEAQFHHVAEREGLLSLTLSLNGDPIDPEILDGFAYEVHQRFRQRRKAAPARSWKTRLGRILDPAALPEAPARD